MSSKGVCESIVLYCTRGACSRGYKRGERGREAPKSPLEEELIEASANIGVQRSVCALLVVRSIMSYRTVVKPGKNLGGAEKKMPQRHGTTTTPDEKTNIIV